MTNYLIIPGLGNSGPEHWQTYWEQSGDNFHRIEQVEWDAPVCANWIDAMDRKVAGFDPATVVLVGHSLGCLTIAHRITHSTKGGGLPGCIGIFF